MNRRRDPIEDTRQWRITYALACVAFSLALLVIGLLARRLGIAG
ncbi:hypothetical protein [Methylocapsa sp. S129]|nr:hypothetical protein [Methylocapsa sp. S129]